MRKVRQDMGDLGIGIASLWMWFLMYDIFGLHCDWPCYCFQMLLWS
jgi:hypothetical protein